eukprot:7774636-Pyramimonas_sp.AAC.1
MRLGGVQLVHQRLQLLHKLGPQGGLRHLLLPRVRLCHHTPLPRPAQCAHQTASVAWVSGRDVGAGVDCLAMRAPGATRHASFNTHADYKRHLSHLSCISSRFDL